MFLVTVMMMILMLMCVLCGASTGQSTVDRIQCCGLEDGGVAGLYRAIVRWYAVARLVFPVSLYSATRVVHRSSSSIVLALKWLLYTMVA